MEKLKPYQTKELVEELRRREGVKAIEVPPYEDKKIIAKAATEGFLVSRSIALRKDAETDSWLDNSCRVSPRCLR